MRDPPLSKINPNNMVRTELERYVKTLEIYIVERQELDKKVEDHKNKLTEYLSDMNIEADRVPPEEASADMIE